MSKEALDRAKREKAAGSVNLGSIRIPRTPRQLITVDDGARKQMVGVALVVVLILLFRDG